MTTESNSQLIHKIQSIADLASPFFERAIEVIKPETEYSGLPTYYSDTDYYWHQLPKELRATALEITNQALSVCGAIAELAKASSLTGSEDLQDIKIAMKTIRAALRLRQYTYREPEAIHDEGTVLGFRPADQSENAGIPPSTAEDEFFNQLRKLAAVAKLVEASPAAASTSEPNSQPSPLKSVPGTAFIMMWMDPKRTELDDVTDTVRETFRSFGIRAVRADDIEHEGLITERVINEIRKAEFLFADLTGTRPNVYYEVGFAHALGKRVILFRKNDTDVHFDLAGYNCPGYTNLRDLRERLTKRLISLTNRNPDTASET